MAIRFLTPADVVQYRTLRLAALKERPPAFGSLPEGEPDLTEMAARLSVTADRCFFGATEANKLVGTVRLSRYSAANEKHRAYLAGLFVSPSYRRQGHGRALLRAAVDHALANSSLSRLNLTVVTDQLAAIRLYETFGFTVYGTEQETFLCDGRFYDEHLMTLDLSASRAAFATRRPVAP